MFIFENNFFPDQMTTLKPIDKTLKWNPKVSAFVF